MKTLQQFINDQRKQNLKDCWEYHKDIINESEPNGPGIKKAELESFLYDVSLNDWEDVGFFIGYLRCLDDIEEFNKIKK